MEKNKDNQENVIPKKLAIDRIICMGVWIMNYKKKKIKIMRIWKLGTWNIRGIHEKERVG